MYSVARNFRRMSVASATKAYRDVKFPVPWGYIAGKDWGKEDGEPWIALHGWLDNCGSFDTLIPLFPETERVIAIDYPGHGLSSHLPLGVCYHFLDCLQYIRRTAQYFKFEKFNLIGHSMGGAMSMMYTVTHPEHVKSLVMLDSAGPLPRSMDAMVKRTRASVDDLLSIENKLNFSKNNSYTYALALQRLIEGTRYSGEASLTEQSAKILLERGLRQVSESNDDAWEFTRDLRHRVASLYQYPAEVIRHIASEIKCPHLIVAAKDGARSWKSTHFEELLDTYTASNPLFNVSLVDGSHHVHLNMAGAVWKHIESFIAKSNP